MIEILSARRWNVYIDRTLQYWVTYPVQVAAIVSCSLYSVFFGHSKGRATYDDTPRNVFEVLVPPGLKLE